MLTVACVNQGDYLGMGEQYVSVLRNMVARHLRQPHEFVCLTESGIGGWWSKVTLFKPGLFIGRVLYLDLDSVIVGPLDEIAETKGMLYLREWGWNKHVYGSGVMVWDAGEHADIFDKFDFNVPHRFEGDQNWIQSLGEWPSLPMHRIKSYRYHCRKGVPDGASVCCFHGTPKPHEITDGWVAREWR